MCVDEEGGREGGRAIIMVMKTCYTSQLCAANINSPEINLLCGEMYC